MKRLIYLTLLLTALVGCKHKYTYIEISKEYGSVRELEKNTIKAKTDSIAYLEAYRSFCISLSSESEVRKSSSDYSHILGFKLMDSKGKAVVMPMSFESKQKQQKALESLIFNLFKPDDIAKTKLENFKRTELLID
ncbi:hypothetical protein [Maribellus mangrovi]|uniref:hypothetical protein n=1 Tax=Maribellus mangrovi TaxID=3133146 RepID=UPI0030EF792D